MRSTMKVSQAVDFHLQSEPEKWSSWRDCVAADHYHVPSIASERPKKVVYDQ
jgi:hypothetical protein